MGMKVLMGSDEIDSSKWNCNNLSSMFGNWGFLLMVYVLPLCLPGCSYVFFFRSKLYWNLGKKPGYALTEQSAFCVGFKK